MAYSNGCTHMVKAASGVLSDTPPVTVMLGDILYHPEAIWLAVKPAGWPWGEIPGPPGGTVASRAARPP